MKLYLNIVYIALVFYTTQACQGDDCVPVCAAERQDPTNQLTFNKKSALAKFNEHFEKEDEKFDVIHDGKCEPPETCPVTEKTSICAIIKVGAWGPPKTFANFCELNKYNMAHPEAEYEYYHDEDCNDVAAAVADDCDCLECENDYWKPVCGVASEPCCLEVPPVSFPNKCMLQKYNCRVPDCQFWYFHEGECYTDLSKL